MLFYVSNFQFLVTTLAFNTSEPFKKPLCYNKLYLASLMLLLVADLMLLVVPADNPVFWMLFHDETFARNGIAYREYYWTISVGILVNSGVTFAAEMLVTKCMAQFDKDRELDGVEGLQDGIV